LLREWGARIWTFPEVLLGPEKPIRIYWKENHEEEIDNQRVQVATVHWYELEKQQFPGLVWKDEDLSMQMVRHYKNTALSRLEFIKIALNCMLHRQEKGIQWHYPGDLSYVLMGFLRVRPPIDKYDSSLQAFARYFLSVEVPIAPMERH
jgi:hypothetical protein